MNKQPAIIAFIWDFDKTLIPEYMQTPLFKYFHVDEELFWKEVNALPDQYLKQGINHVSRETVYLNHIQTYIKKRIFKHLDNALLKELGKELRFHSGVPEVFSYLKNTIQENPEYKGIQVEHYIISTGLYQMISGSIIAPYIDGIWANEFLENEHHELDQIAYSIDGTSKTRAFFEINKGTNKDTSIDVNTTIPLEKRRIPFSHMIYIADGPSDIPSFSTVAKNGGKTVAVYKPHSKINFDQAYKLYQKNRVEFFGPADYSEDSYMRYILTALEKEIADIIVNKSDDGDHAVHHILNDKIVAGT